MLVEIFTENDGWLKPGAAVDDDEYRVYWPADCANFPEYCFEVADGDWRYFVRFAGAGQDWLMRPAEPVSVCNPRRITIGAADLERLLAMAAPYCG